MSLFASFSFLFASFLGAGTHALALHKHGKLGPIQSPDLERNPLTAMCLAGNARYFAVDSVANSLSLFIDNLNGRGSNASKPDVYAYLTLEGADPKGGNWDFNKVSASKSDVEKVLQNLGALAFELEDHADEVNTGNVERYVKNRKECFSSGYFGESPEGDNLARSLNQLLHIQKCLHLLSNTEQRLGKQYETIIIARPDLRYSTETSLDLAAVRDGAVLVQWDWFMAIPRALMNNLLSSRKAAPLNCNPGETCCGRVTKSEYVFEYLLEHTLVSYPNDWDQGYSSGLYTCYHHWKSCKCSDALNVSIRVKVASIVRGDWDYNDQWDPTCHVQPEARFSLPMKLK